MGFLDNVKAFVHSITTNDHYASYDSPYRTQINDDDALTGPSVGAHPNGSSMNLNADMNVSRSSLNDSTAGGFYRPGLRSSQSQLGQDVQLQNFDANGLPPLPSIDSLWDRIEHWIDEEYPELDDNLNDGVTSADLNEFLQDLRCGSRSLPEDFRQFYKRHDGQLRGGKPTGLIMGLVLLDLESIVEENILWNKVAERLERQQYMAQHQQKQNELKEGNSSQLQRQGSTFITNQRSIPPNSIQPYYYNKGWVILLKDNIGNQVAMDLNPGPNGTWGQIILFGRDFDTKLVIAHSLQEFIFEFTTDLESGNFLIDSSEYQEELGFLSSDRDGDFMIGDEDENQGELSFFDRDGKEFGKDGSRGRPSYIEVLKKRTLKKYGLTENFQTAYQPPKPVKKIHESGRSSPYLNQSRSGSNVNLKTPFSKNNSSTSLSAAQGKNKPAVSSPLVNLDNNSSSFTIPKETIIDGKLKPEPSKTESAVKEESKNEKPLENDFQELSIDEKNRKPNNDAELKPEDETVVASVLEESKSELDSNKAQQAGEKEDAVDKVTEPEISTKADLVDNGEDANDDDNDDNDDDDDDDDDGDYGEEEKAEQIEGDAKEDTKDETETEAKPLSKSQKKRQKKKGRK
ncbi:Smi1 cell wall biosynthesis protein [Candida orthopsilosis Co 90-125]|uniref:Smi1 cell wall biosynthesis protein n=1 Tax=Candida orthopsilosis (strain 90-125) TaxID=1136231 RepID=H8WX13_CANO9|nr:Smi1 cell wall biosynthesis protein [Candida orthopsilosis Co 90-125]CCG21153.1 Smi1 cell wall biosynthesis protein [Candida orthopsilosis Co 90-125]